MLKKNTQRNYKNEPNRNSGVKKYNKTEVKISLEEQNCIFKQAEERISEFEYR